MLDKSQQSQCSWRHNNRRFRGDTIVEVLISIAVAAFAIGTSYAIANKSIDQAITARERNQAINVIESQINALKFREQNTDTPAFTSQFSYPSPLAANFCLSEASTSSSDTSPAHPWAPIPNTGTNCLRNGIYNVSITTTHNDSAAIKTVYYISVTWPRQGGGVNQAGIYYRF